VGRVFLRFYGELNDFLPPAIRQRTLQAALDGPASTKSAIESCGVPHTEVDLVLVNGEPATLATPVAEGDRVSVFPRFRSLAPDPQHRLQPPPTVEARFVLDVHLGRLASYLRLAGFDTAYRNDCSDQELAAISGRDDRMLLTRDRELLKRSVVVRGYWLRHTEPRRQFVEVVRAFGLAGRIAPFTRCARCNTPLEAVSWQAVIDRLPPRVRIGRDEFLRCSGCGRVYWDGTHVEKIRQFFRLALAEPPEA